MKQKESFKRNRITCVCCDYQDASQNLLAQSLIFSHFTLTHTCRVYTVQSVPAECSVYIYTNSFFISLCYRCYLLFPACSRVLSHFSKASGVKGRRRRLLVHRIPDNLRKLFHHDPFLLQILDENRLVELGKFRDSGGHMRDTFHDDILSRSILVQVRYRDALFAHQIRNLHLDRLRVRRSELNPPEER